MKKIEWADFIPENGEFPISWVSSVKSKLFSKSDIQKIAKKAMVEKMKETYKKDYFYEDGALYAIKIVIFYIIFNALLKMPSTCYF